GLVIRQPGRVGHYRAHWHHEGDRAAVRHGNDGGGSFCTGVEPDILGWRDFDAAARCDLQRDGRVRWLFDWRSDHRRGLGSILVADASERRSAGRYPEWGHQKRGVRGSGYPDCAVRRLRCAAHGRRRLVCRDANCGHFGARRSGARFRAHVLYVYRSLTMKRTTVDLWVGVFVTAGVAALLTLALKVGNATTVTAANGYEVYGEFENIGGLKARAPVKSSGVVVGRVDSIVLDQQKYVAKVIMRL